VSFEITVQPSGHRFEAEPSESLLEAGLRAGLNLDHQCATGSCGRCLARLLSGDVAYGHADYPITETDRAQGRFLMCRTRAAGDVSIEAHEAGSAAEILPQLVQARVGKVERLQDDMVQLTLRTPRSQALHFLAGQGVELRFDGLDARTLSIASCPCDGIQLRFHVRRRDGDPFTDFVFDEVRRGHELELRGPCGDFTLDEASARPLVFVAWESGFAPVGSLIDHAIQKDENRSIDLYWLSAIPGGHYLSNYCRAWRDVLDDFRYHSIDLRPAGDEDIDAVVQRIVRVHGLLADHDYYLALPAPALAQARRFLDEAGVPQARVHTLETTYP
jgi:CDP-4-dehydro-6-deoxyglucose reductase